MRSSLLVIAIVSLATSFSDTAAEPPNDDDASTLASKISDVTVYADRARITRTTRVGVRGGAARFAFRKLPGWIDEGSVRVSLTPPEAGELADVQVLKTFLARPDDQEIRAAETAVTEVSDQIAALDDELAALDAQQRQTDAIRVFSLEKLPKDAAVREVKLEEYNGVVKFVGSSMLELAKGKREIEKKKRELQPELHARQQKLADLRQRAQLEQRTVVVVVKGNRETEVSMALTYMVPGTTWEPTHELRASQDGSSVSLASYAVVTQTTGEDWDGATLTFSTQRPTATARIPELEALLLGGGRSLGRVIGAEAQTFQSAVANFEAQNTVWNAINNRMDVQQAWSENIRSQKQRQEKVAEMFQQVQQRGTTAQFPALGSQTVRSDGRMVRMSIGTARFSASPRIVAAPEMSLNAVQTADLVNTCGQPLLPGKVHLYAEGAFIGTTETDFVAPGENFSVFLGVADRLKLSRTLDQKRSSLSWTGKRKQMLAAFVVTTENLSDKPVSFQLADRIPVSETEEIRVRDVKLQPDAKPDVKGLLKWEVTLPAKAKKEFHLEYTLDYPAELPVLTPVPASASVKGVSLEKPVNESVDRSDRLYRQIGDLEKSLKK